MNDHLAVEVNKDLLCFITDDCEAEIAVLRDTFPEATLLLCIFHFLKAVYQGLRTSKNGWLRGRISKYLYHSVIPSALLLSIMLQRNSSFQKVDKNLFLNDGH